MTNFRRVVPNTSITAVLRKARAGPGREPADGVTWFAGIFQHLRGVGRGCPCCSSSPGGWELGGRGESWPLNPDGIPCFSSLSLYQRSFIYLQHFSVLFLPLSSVSLWPALTPLGTFQFSGPLRQQKFLQCWCRGLRGRVQGGVPKNSSCKPSS